MTDLSPEEIRDIALLNSMARNDTHAVEKLLENGANPNAKDEHGYTMLSLVAEWGYTEIARLLIKKGAVVDPEWSGELTPLMKAAFMGHADVVRLLIENGADVNRSNETGATALIFSAFREGGTASARLLVENGADLWRRNGDNKTALEVAENFQHAELMALLKEAPAIQRALRLEAEHKAVVRKQEHLKIRARRFRQGPQP